MGKSDGLFDTGLFLDHRITRRMLGEMSKGKDFRNLFLIPAAPAYMRVWRRAQHHATVDMSRTYLKMNVLLRLNGLSAARISAFQADCSGCCARRMNSSI